MFVHPLMHSPYVISSQRKDLLGVLLRTKYIRRVIRHHWLHHKYPTYNFNLLLLGDFLLGTHLEPSESDIEEMRDSGIPLD